MLITGHSISWEYIRLYSWNENDESKSIKKKQFGIPVFQRFYDWKKDYILKIEQDIVECFTEPSKDFYLLDFIWYEEDGRIKLADGQQRLVSVNLLIKATNDVIDEKALPIAKLEPFSITYDINAYNEKYQKTMNGGMISSPFKPIYLAFRDFVLEHIADVSKILSVIQNRIFVYMKKCGSPDEAFDIFQQINTGNKPLNKDEIIKTTIDQYSQIYGVPITIDLKKKDLTNTVVSYYKMMVKVTASNFDNIAVISFLKNYVVNSKASFQKFVTSLTTLIGSKDSPMACVIGMIERKQLLDILNVLSLKGINTDKNHEYVEKLMIPLCLLSLCMRVNNINPGGVILTLYAGIIEMIKSNKTADDISGFLASFINDHPDICKTDLSKFDKALEQSDFHQGRKEAILIMDVMLKNTTSTLVMSNINLEHIYPQKPKPEWATKGWPTSHDKQLEVISNIGNYLLLNQHVNKKIKNKYIDDKVSEYNKIIPLDSALRTPLNTVDFAEFKIKRDRYIRQRQHDIAKSVMTDFPFGPVLIIDDTGEPEEIVAKYVSDIQKEDE